MDWANTDWFTVPYKSITDKRLDEVRHVESDFPLKRFTDLAQWEAYRAQALQNMRISAGLFPEPEKCPLQPKRFGKIEFDGFTVEKVLIQCLPDFYIAGNLYWPKDISAPIPMILNPHGHWDNGRFEMSDVTKIPQRCANFALLGMASFSFDMVGFGDSRQMKHHGYFGYTMDLWNESLLGLQIFNCIRALDFAYSLDEVDQSKIGCTGASGGGTQTIWLAALDNRIAASMPVNMVSTLFQGSCTCEIAPNLHLELSNIEIAAMTAPRPVNLAGSTGDWTRDLPDVCYPWVRSIYELYSKPDNAEYFFHEGPHNYNTEAQENAYEWFSRRLLGKEKGRIAEREIDFGGIERLRVNAEDIGLHLRSFTHIEFFALQKQRKTQRIQKAHDSEHGKDELKSVLRHAIGDCTVCFEAADESEEVIDSLRIRKMLLASENGAQLPAVALCRDDGRDLFANRDVLLIASERGKKSALEEIESAGYLDKILGNGYVIVSADLFLMGEYNKPYGNAGRNFKIPVCAYCENNYITTYNRTDAAYRIQDFIGVYAYIKKLAKSVIPIGLGDAAPWVVCALPFLAEAMAACADVSAFDGRTDSFYVERFFLPGFLAAGGFETCRAFSHAVEFELEELMESL